MLQNTKVSLRLFFLVGLSVLFLVISSVVALVELSLVSHDFNVVSDNFVPSLYTISTVRGAMNRVVILEKRHILNNESEKLFEIERAMQDKKDEVASGLAKYERDLLLAGEERLFFDDVRRRWEDYLEVHEKVIQLSSDLKTEEARALSGEH